MIATDQALSEVALPKLDAGPLLRRAAVPALLSAAAVAAITLGGGRIHAFVDEMLRGLSVSPSWAVAGAVFEVISIAGYVGLLSLVAGRAAPRVGMRESAQITLAGAAATRLLPTAGVGGVALALWALRRAGLGTRAATRTLLVFMVVLYSVFLASIVASGAVLALGLVHSSGPTELAAVPAVGAMLCIGLFLVLASRHDARSRRGQADSEMLEGGERETRPLVARAAAGARLIGDAVDEACQLVRQRDARLVGAIAYWAFDAAVLWAMLHAFGSSPVLPVVALAYFVGQIANTLPIPGSVSGGITGALIAFGVPAEVALPSVLAYRAVAVWLPSPVAVAAIPALRATLARWGHEDDATLASA